MKRHLRVSFSVLDYRTDKKLREALKKECADTTRLIVAQRIGTIRDADRIIVLDEGKMAGMGGPDGRGNEEKAHDLFGTWKKLLGYCRKYWAALLQTWMYVRFFTQPLSQMVQSLQSAAAAGERVFEFFEAETAAYDCPCNDCQQTAADTSVDAIQKYEETATGSFLYSIYVMAKAARGDADMVTGEGHIYLAEQKVIRHFVMDGPAIFLGHCASEALKEKENVVRVFIRCSDDGQKNQRIETDYGISRADVESTKKRFDKKRSNYYYANTTLKWENLRNYDIVLDSAVIGTRGCVDLLKGIV